jgi:hypothetical protein
VQCAKEEVVHRLPKTGFRKAADQATVGFPDSTDIPTVVTAAGAATGTRRRAPAAPKATAETGSLRAFRCVRFADVRVLDSSPLAT